MKAYAMTGLAAMCLLQLFAMTSAGLGAVRANLTYSPVTASSFSVNLRTGVSSGLPSGISWHSSLTGNQVAGRCDRQGVLKLSFTHTSRRRAQINMTFDDSVDWTFNVGDSSSNNGYGGDSGTQDNDAEVHSKGHSIYFYGRDNPSGGTYGLLHSRTNFVGTPSQPSLTLNIADEMASADNGDGYISIDSHKLFALSGQSDSSPGGVNRDVYLGMNRVVGTSVRKGRGLCTVRVKFYSS